MIGGRTKGSLARFFRDQGAWWCEQVEIVVSDGILLISGSHRAVPTRCSSRSRSFSCRPVVHRRTHPGAAGTATPSPRSAAPNVRAGPVPSPLHSPTAGGSSNRSPPSTPRPAVRRSSPVSEPPGTRFKSSTSCTKPTTSMRPTKRWDGSLTSMPPDRSPNTATSWTRSSRGERRSWPTTAADEHPTGPSRESTTSSKSYAESPTDSPTPTTTQPADSL